MIIWPLRPCAGWPSTSRLTRSWLMRVASALRSGRAPRGIVDQAAAAVIDHVGKLVTIVLDETLHWPGGSIAERADRVALDAVRDVDQQVQVRVLRLSC